VFTIYRSETNYILFPRFGLFWSHNKYTQGVPVLTPGFKGGSYFSIFSFMCMFWRSLFVLLYFFVWPLCCLFFFNIRILITPLVSSNSSSKHQRGNKNPYIEDEQKTQLSNYILPIFLQEMITSTPLHLRVAINLENLVTNPMISHEWAKEREVIAINGTYPWSFVTQIFHSGQPSHGGDCKTFQAMTST
jgi:hypothetical protein